MTKHKVIWGGLMLLVIASLGAILGFFWGKQKNLAHFYFGTTGGVVNVYLNGQKIGTSLIKDYQLTSGIYELGLETDYYHYRTPIQFSPGTATIVDWHSSNSINKSSGIIYELYQSEQALATLQIVSYPERAIVNLKDNSQSYFTPIQLDHLTTGEKELTLSLPGYQTLTIPFTLTLHYLLKITAKLASDSS